MVLTPSSAGIELGSCGQHRGHLPLDHPVNTVSRKQRVRVTEEFRMRGMGEEIGKYIKRQLFVIRTEVGLLDRVTRSVRSKRIV